MAMSKSFRVFHKLEPPYSVLLDCRDKKESLMFESNAVAVLSNHEADSLRKKQYIKLLDAYGCLGVLILNVGDEFILYLVMVTGCISVGKIGESEIFRVTSTSFVSLRNQPSDEERVAEVRRLLNSGTFYFSWSATGVPIDLSLCAQRRMKDHETDNRFFWNRALHLHLQRFSVNTGEWLLKTMCGGIEIRTIYAADKRGKACLISRLSCERAGTRFNVRGTNDDGHVANFVETEQAIFIDNSIASYLQTRGSVPLFWEQPGIQVGSHKVKMSRGHEASAPAFDKHLTTQRKQYGEQVIVNLLGSKEGERMLSQIFQSHHKASSHKQDIPHIAFDYHTEMKANPKNIYNLKNKVKKQLKEFDIFYAKGDKVTRQQTGTIRTNCLDCLDRTNAVQTLYGLEVLVQQLESLGLADKPQMMSRFVEVFKQMWGLNGDHVSRIYAGTGALGGGRSKYTDAARSATRTIQNNFLDSSKQEAIDILLLGNALRSELSDRARSLLSNRSLHASPMVLRDMVLRHREYTDTTHLRVFAGTWNVNGGKHFRSVAFKHESIEDWLLDLPKITKEKDPDMLIEKNADYEKPVDIFSIGFEEIVDLNAGNIVNASSANVKEWSTFLQKTISREHKYVLLTSAQLVGVCLYIFIRPHLAPYIRDVAVDSVKTGMGGAAGNKGGVAIRFLIHNSSFCFVCSHFAAGQSQVAERNSDFTDIFKRISFPMGVSSSRAGRTIDSHEYVFWMGDFNYRIDLPNEEVKQLIVDENWSALQSCDQLNKQREEGKTFNGFWEGNTDFPPTYKYDLFCNDYDTSEKMRTPAWTDRVLWRRRWLPTCKAEGECEWDTGKLLLYNRADFKTSDHRPVMALFDIEVLQVKDKDRDEILQEVIEQQGPQDGTIVITSAEMGEFSDAVIDNVLETIGQIGDIVLVRFISDDMLITLRSGKDALECLKFDRQEIGGEKVRVRLRTIDWKRQIEKEINLTGLESEGLYNPFTNSLLGEDFEEASLNYDMEGDDLDEEHMEPDSDEDITGFGLELPPFDMPSGLHTPGDGSPTEEDLEPIKKTPPSRPSAPPPRPSDGPKPASGPVAPPRPSRPPPPKRPPPPSRPANPPAKPTTPDSPSRSRPIKPAPPAAAVASYPPVAVAPKRPSTQPPSIRPNSMISRPMNVQHQGCKDVGEAEKLIEKLMSGNSVDQHELPAPLLPAEGAKASPIEEKEPDIPKKVTPEEESVSLRKKIDDAGPAPPPRPSVLETSAPGGPPVPAPRASMIAPSQPAPALPARGPPPPVPVPRSRDGPPQIPTGPLPVVPPRRKGNRPPGPPPALPNRPDVKSESPANLGSPGTPPSPADQPTPPKPSPRNSVQNSPDSDVPLPPVPSRPNVEVNGSEPSQPPPALPQ
ncbi:synaptojanin-1-like isoform X2 [Lineus longissimus]|uniref:synaptojanin-1-like isoform X2 n=1 Tax=Lineus longissimus TaxID=88925 RepID=UPI00315C9211